MHAHPAGIVASTEGSGRHRPEPCPDDGVAIRLIREGPEAQAACPHCGGRLRLSTVGSRWLARSPRAIADRLAIQLGSLEREELHVLALDARYAVIEQERVYQGNVSQAIARVGELFRTAILRNASAVILCHNHPSGSPDPSPDDLHLTAEAVAAGRLLDIDVLDHIVIGGSSFVSLRDRGVVVSTRTIGHGSRERSSGRGRLGA